MTILETKHTLSRVNIIKKDLFKAVAIVGCISMLAFMAYYIYLISQNLQNGFYITFYSILISTIILFFVVEISIKEESVSHKNEKRLAIEKKRKLKFIIKILKYIAKTALITLAIYETVTNFNISISNVVNICSGIFLVIQILFDFMAHYIIKQIDYFRLSFDKDFSDSCFLIKKLLPMKVLEDKVLDLEGKRYTPLEQKMLKDIENEAEKYFKEQEEKEKMLKEKQKELEGFHKPKKIKIKLPFIKLFKKKEK